MSLPDIPSDELATLDDVTTCRQVVASVARELPQIDDIATLDEVHTELASLLARVRKHEVSSEIEVAARRVELRIGELFNDGGDASGLDQRRVSEFSKFARHSDVVEFVLDNSTQDEPATRNRVLQAVNEVEPPKPRAPKPDLSAHGPWPQKAPPEPVPEPDPRLDTVTERPSNVIDIDPGGEPHHAEPVDDNSDDGKRAYLIQRVIALKVVLGELTPEMVLHYFEPNDTGPLRDVLTTLDSWLPEMWSVIGDEQ